jgi:hypothetical protein
VLVKERIKDPGEFRRAGRFRVGIGNEVVAEVEVGAGREETSQFPE